MASNRRHTKTPAKLLPDPSRLKGNAAELEKARLAAEADAEERRVAATQPPDRHSDGRFAKMNAVHLAEPETPDKPAGTSNAGRRRRRGGAVPTVGPVALPQPYVHLLDEPADAVVYLEVRPYVEKVTPEQSPAVSFLDELRKDELSQKRAKWWKFAIRLVLGLVLLLALSLLGFAIYIGFTSVS